MHDTATERMDWDDLRLFLAIAREGTLGGAAATLGVNASTVQRRLSRLERSLEGALFDRSQRGSQLTLLGEALLPEAERVEASVSAARRVVRGHDQTATGPVVITLPETLVTLVTPALAEVCAACPGLRPTLKTDDRMLELGSEADLALRPGDHPPDHVVGRRLGALRWALYSTQPAPRSWLIYSDGPGPVNPRAWRRAHHPRPTVLFDVGSVGGMHRALAASQSQGLLPLYVGDPDPRLIRLTDPIEAAETELWLLIHADLRRSARVRAVVDLLVPRIVLP